MKGAVGELVALVGESKEAVGNNQYAVRREQNDHVRWVIAGPKKLAKTREVAILEKKSQA